jgi:hypothetical protein
MDFIDGKIPDMRTPLLSELKLSIFIGTSFTDIAEWTLALGSLLMFNYMVCII